MTFKLMKYEFRSIVKLLGIVWIALPVTAILAGFFEGVVFPDEGFPQEFPLLANLITAVTNFLYIAIFVALIVVTVMIILMRFYKGLLREEGYLMHTLPVKTWQLITAKGVVAVCVSLISMAVAVLSILLLTLFDGWQYLGDFLPKLGEIIAKRPFLIVMGIEIIMLCVSGLLAMIYKVYASLCIGQLAQKHRIALSVGAYIGIGIVGTILLSIVGNAAVELLEGVIDSVERWFSGLGADSSVGLVLLVLILFEMVQVVIYHVISEQILRRKLNLE